MGISETRAPGVNGILGFRKTLTKPLTPPPRHRRQGQSDGIKIWRKRREGNGDEMTVPRLGYERGKKLRDHLAHGDEMWPYRHSARTRQPRTYPMVSPDM